MCPKCDWVGVQVWLVIIFTHFLSVLQLAQDTSRGPCLGGLEPSLWLVGDLHNIRKVVLMLWLISVNCLLYMLTEMANMVDITGGKH